MLGTILCCCIKDSYKLWTASSKSKPMFTEEVPSVNLFAIPVVLDAFVLAHPSAWENRNPAIE